MKHKIIESKSGNIAIIDSNEILIKTVQDALDLLMNFYYNDCNTIMLNEKNFVPEFFDLKSKLAGEMLQKFSTYQCRMAIVGDFSNVQSKSLNDFIYESNKTGRIVFAGNEEAAMKLLKP